MSDQWVRIEFPGGHVRVVRQTTYHLLVQHLNALASSLQNVKFLDELNGEEILGLKSHGREFWRGLLKPIEKGKRVKGQSVLEIYSYQTAKGKTYDRRKI